MATHEADTLTHVLETELKEESGTHNNHASDTILPSLAKPSAQSRPKSVESVRNVTQEAQEGVNWSRYKNIRKVKGPKVRVATFNTENLVARYKFRAQLPSCDDFFTRLDTAFDLHDAAQKRLTAALICEVDADVLCLMEVESLSTLEYFNVTYLKPLNYHYSLLIEAHDPRFINVAILSRFPIIACRSHKDDLDPNGSYLLTRSCLEADIDVLGVPLTVYLNHFRSMRGSEDGRWDSAQRRMQQAERVRDIVNARWAAVNHHGNFVVLGDLNDKNDKLSAIRALTRHPELVNIIERLPKSEQWTHHFKMDDSYSQLDYILVSKTLATTCCNENTAPIILRHGLARRATRYTGFRYPAVGLDRPKASDHCPMSIDLQLFIPYVHPHIYPHPHPLPQPYKPLLPLSANSRRDGPALLLHGKSYTPLLESILQANAADTSRKSKPSTSIIGSPRTPTRTTSNSTLEPPTWSTNGSRTPRLDPRQSAQTKHGSDGFASKKGPLGVDKTDTEFLLSPIDHENTVAHAIITPQSQMQSHDVLMNLQQVSPKGDPTSRHNSNFIQPPLITAYTPTLAAATQRLHNVPQINLSRTGYREDPIATTNPVSIWKGQGVSGVVTQGKQQGLRDSAILSSQALPAARTLLRSGPGLDPTSGAARALPPSIFARAVGDTTSGTAITRQPQTSSHAVKSTLDSRSPAFHPRSPQNSDTSNHHTTAVLPLPLPPPLQDAATAPTPALGNLSPGRSGDMSGHVAYLLSDDVVAEERKKAKRKAKRLEEKQALRAQRRADRLAGTGYEDYILSRDDEDYDDDIQWESQSESLSTLSSEDRSVSDQRSQFLHSLKSRTPNDDVLTAGASRNMASETSSPRKSYAKALGNIKTKSVTESTQQRPKSPDGQTLKAEPKQTVEADTTSSEEEVDEETLKRRLDQMKKSKSRLKRSKKFGGDSDDDWDDDGDYMDFALAKGQSHARQSKKAPATPQLSSLNAKKGGNAKRGGSHSRQWNEPESDDKQFKTEWDEGKPRGVHTFAFDEAGSSKHRDDNHHDDDGHESATTEHSKASTRRSNPPKDGKKMSRQATKAQRNRNAKLERARKLEEKLYARGDNTHSPTHLRVAVSNSSAAIREPQSLNGKDTLEIADDFDRASPSQSQGNNGQYDDSQSTDDQNDAGNNDYEYDDVLQSRKLDISRIPIPASNLDITDSSNVMTSNHENPYDNLRETTVQFTGSPTESIHSTTPEAVQLVSRLRLFGRRPSLTNQKLGGASPTSPNQYERVELNPAETNFFKANEDRKLRQELLLQDLTAALNAITMYKRAYEEEFGELPRELRRVAESFMTPRAREQSELFSLPTQPSADTSKSPMTSLSGLANDTTTRPIPLLGKEATKPSFDASTTTPVTLPDIADAEFEAKALAAELAVQHILQSHSRQADQTGANAAASALSGNATPTTSIEPRKHRRSRSDGLFRMDAHYPF